MPARTVPLALAAVAALVAACNEPAVREPEAPFSPATIQHMSEAFMMGSGGVYDREGASAGVLTIEREGDQWRLTIRAGGVPDGAATAADCELDAVGPFVEGVFNARLAPFESELGGLSAEDLGDDPPSIRVSVTPNSATVSDPQHAATRYCAAGSDITGQYLKRAG